MRRLTILFLCTGCARVAAPGIDVPVGTAEMVWHDSLRSEVWTGDPSDHRVMRVVLWYPALAPVGVAPSRAAASPAPPLTPVLFSPGADMAPDRYRRLATDLASHGYMVIGIDHSYEGSGQRVDGGRMLRPDPEHRMPEQRTPDFDARFLDFYRFRVEQRVSDLRFVAAHLPSLLADSLPEAVGRLSSEGIVAMGHSIGGVAAFEACRTDTRFMACVDLDGWALRFPFFSTLPSARASALLYIGKPLSRRPPPRTDQQRDSLLMLERALRARADSTLTASGHAHYWVTMWDAKHDTFGVSTHLGGIAAYVLEFLDAYVHGRHAVLLTRSYHQGFRASVEPR